MHVFFLVTFLFQPIATYQNAKATQTDLIGIYFEYFIGFDWICIRCGCVCVCFCFESAHFLLCDSND